jgi:DnaK suppressor protein
LLSHPEIAQGIAAILTETPDNSSFPRFNPLVPALLSSHPDGSTRSHVDAAAILDATSRGRLDNMTSMRRAELAQFLEDRRDQIHQDVQSRKRVGRAGRPTEVGDIGDDSEAGSQAAIDFALLQRTAEALGRVDAALGRIEAGEYGDCLDCHVEISEQRLRALPFAVRCTACEERHEDDAARARRPSRWHDGPSHPGGLEVH